jgi:hypothetical protein
MGVWNSQGVQTIAYWSLIAVGFILFVFVLVPRVNKRLSRRSGNRLSGNERFLASTWGRVFLVASIVVLVVAILLTDSHG